MRRWIVAVALISILLPTQGCRAGDAPAVAATPAEGVAGGGEQEAALVFEDPAEAAAFEAARAHARRENQRLLIRWGSESVERSAELTQLLADEREIARKILYEYQLVPIEVEVGGQNLDLLGRYGSDLEGATDELPYLTILDADGQVVANRDATSLMEGDQYDTGKILGFLSEHQPDYLQAADVLAAVLAEAASTERLVFLHSGAPW